MKGKNEIVTLSLSVRLEYETKAGREYLLQRLVKEVEIDMGGGGDVGIYSMKSVDGTARVKPNDHRELPPPTMPENTTASYGG